MTKIILVLLAITTAVVSMAFTLPQCSSCTSASNGIVETNVCTPGIRVVDTSQVTCTVNSPSTGKCRVSGTVTVAKCTDAANLDACVIIQDDWGSTPTDINANPATFSPNPTLGNPVCPNTSYNLIVFFGSTWTGTNCSNGAAYENASYLRTYTCN